MKKLFVGATIASGLTALLLSGPAAGEPIELKFSSPSPPRAHLNVQFFAPWVKTVTRDSQGTLDVKLVAGRILASHRNIYDRVRTNFAQIGWGIQAFFPGKFPKSEVVGLPLLYDTSREGSLALWHLFEKGLISDEYKAVKLLFVFAFPPNSLHTKFPVKRLDDAFFTLLLAARNVSNGDLGGDPSRSGSAAYYVTRSTYVFSRGIPELVWAMIIVFFLSPGILPGALALGLHNYGIVGRLTAEVVENLDPAPTRALRAAGAGKAKILLYGILPQALPQFITYLLYRWEVVIRTTVVVGFVGAGGLGREFALRLDLFHYPEVGIIIVWYLALVIGVDLLSGWLRRLARFD